MDKLRGRFASTALGLISAVMTTTAISGEPVVWKVIFWGDLHTHTAYSMDAYVLNTQTTPADAYRFAQGGPIAYSAGTRNCNDPWILQR